MCKLRNSQHILRGSEGRHCRTSLPRRKRELKVTSNSQYLLPIFGNQLDRLKSELDKFGVARRALFVAFHTVLNWADLSA